MLKKLQYWLIKLECYFRIRPVTFFQLFAFLFSRDFTTSGLIALYGAYSIGDSLVEALIRKYDVKTLQKLLAFIDQYTDCVYEPINLEEIMGSDFVNLLGKRSVSYETVKDGWRTRINEWIYGKKLYNKASIDTKIFIMKPKKGEVSPNSPTTFPLRLGGYVFLLDDPKNLKSTAKFIFLHELGHLSMEGNLPVIHSHIGNLPYYLVAFYAIFQLNTSILAVFLWAVYFVLCKSFLKFSWQIFSEYADALHEIQADFFAFQHMEDEDRKKAASFLKTHSVLDKKLIPPFDEFRNKILQDNIDLIISDKDKLIYRPFKNKTPFFILFFLAATMIMAFFVQPQNIVSLFFEFVIVLTIFIFQVQTYFQERKLLEVVNANLEYRRFY
jgi:hypothetical protein